MDANRLVRISKYLSKHLRHQPERIGLQLQQGGWVAVADLLHACTQHGFPLTFGELAEVVARNGKQRFAFDESGTRIRAQQGHSVAVDLDLEPRVPPPLLYHGTVARNLDAILRSGLLPMSRHHVHLSPDEQTARVVGARRGTPLLLRVHAAAMHHDRFIFYRSGNGVWLVDHVPPQYLALGDDQG